MYKYITFWVIRFFRILERRKHLLSEIKEVRRTRALQRAARKRQKDSQGKEIATVAVVGYTNAVGDLYSFYFPL